MCVIIFVNITPVSEVTPNLYAQVDACSSQNYIFVACDDEDQQTLL